MHLLFVKLHLIIFEVISLILLGAIFSALFYYSIIFPNINAMKENKDDNSNKKDNIGLLNVKFSAKLSRGVFSDVDIKLYDPNSSVEDPTHSAAILYNEKNYNKDDNIIQKISESTPSNIFLFEDEKIATNFKHHLLNLKSESSTFNLVLFGLISLFLIFIKITLLKDSYLRLKKIKSSKSDGKNEVYTNLLAQIHPEEFALPLGQEEQKNVYYNPVLSFLNPINVYYYLIFHLTIVIIIPLIFPDFIEYYLRSYLGFMPNMTFSVYYGRSLFGTDRLNSTEIEDLSKLIVGNKTVYPISKLFLLHNYLDLTDYKPTNLNPYMVNLLIMCGSIWLSQIFHPFDSQTSVKIVDVDLKKGKLKKNIKIVSIIAVFGVWGFFIIDGLLYELDIFYLYHRLLFCNFQRFFDLKIPLFLFLFYYHIYFYTIMFIYTYQTYKKNKKYEGNQKVIYNWFT